MYWPLKIFVNYSLLMFKLQRLCALVANVRGPPVLYRTRIDIRRCVGPLVTLSGKSLERFAIKVYERLANHRLHLTVATLHVHHHGDGDTASFPILGLSRCVFHDGDDGDGSLAENDSPYGNGIKKRNPARGQRSGRTSG